MSVSLGTAIYIALKPIFKIYTIIFVGFLLAKYNIVSMENAKGISNMVVNAILPCLTFNKIVTNISWRDIKEVGVIILSAIILFLFGASGALLTNHTTPVPKTFYWSMIFAGLFPNISDLPIAYTQSMGTGAIFTEAESEKGVAYSCIFLFTQSFLMMNFGMWRMVGFDFRDTKKNKNDIEEGSSQEILFEKNQKAQEIGLGSEIHSENVRETTSQLPRNSIESHSNSSTISTSTFALSSLNSDMVDDENGYSTGTQNYVKFYNKETNGNRSIKSPLKVEKPITAHFIDNLNNLEENPSIYSSPANLEPVSENLTNIKFEPPETTLHSRRSRRASINDVISSFSAVEKIRTGEIDLHRPLSVTEEVGQANTSLGVIETSTDETGIIENNLNSNDDLQRIDSKIPISKWRNFKQNVSKFIKDHNLGWVAYFAINFCRPASLGALLGIICALIPWIKALFVETYVHVHQAPDQLPVLNFLMDFTAYIGNACIPLGLLLLGGTLARLELRSLPKGFNKSVALMTAFRLIISPIIGILWANKLYDLNWLDSRIGKFVMILTWSMPCSTSQVYFTAFYTPVVGSHVQMDCLSIFFVAQYAILFITLSFVVTWTLKVDLKV